MKRLVVIVAGMMLGAFGTRLEADDAVSVTSFNIRYNNPADGPNAWPHRQDWVAEIIRKNADVVGLQEVRKDQLDDLKERLPDYEFYGVGRDDGKEAGEFVPLAWKKDRFTATEKGEFWLSETPGEPSKGWDAQLPRVTTWVRLKDDTTGKTLLAVNTHFDHRGNPARRESGTLIQKWIAAHAKGDAVVLTGDFNTLPDSPPYRNLTAEANGITLRDARLAVDDPQGPDSTWNGFKEIAPGRRIDFVFTTGPATVTAFRTLDETREGRFPSDHLPIVATVKLGATK
ncbi:MAG: endonuclease/exonuclease/phosphatase family protein [Planctomycetaceae bacterium]